MTNPPPYGQSAAAGGHQPGYGAPGYGAPGGATPGYGAPWYGAPGYGAPQSGQPQSGQPGLSAPGYGVGGFAPQGYGVQKRRGKWAPDRLGWSGLDFLLLLLGIVLGSALAFLSAKLQFDAQASGERIERWSSLTLATTACATFWFAWAFLCRKPGIAFVLGAANYFLGHLAISLYASWQTDASFSLPIGEGLVYFLGATLFYGIAYEVAVGFTAYRNWGAWMPAVAVILFALLTTIVTAIYLYLVLEIPLQLQSYIANFGEKAVTGVVLVYLMWGLGNLRFGQSAAQQPFAQPPQYGTPYGQGFPR